jgi:MYND finger
VLCGRWETYPREFAKCRRCRKAKYCGKECQSTAWSEGHRFWCSVKEGDEETAEPIDQLANPEVTVAGESGVEPPSGVMMTAGGTVTGRVERRAERERERQARERALVTIATGADTTQTARGGAFRSSHNPNTATTTLGHQTPRATATGANRPLLAPPVQPWANRSALPYLRSADTPDGIGPPPAAPRTVFNPYQGRSPTVNVDAGHSPGRRRAETMSGVLTGSSMDISETSRRPETSRYFPGVHSDGAGPSGRRPGDHDMTT